LRIASNSSGGEEFPGLALACLFGLLFWFGVAMLIFSGPWGGDDSLAPQVSVAPDIGIGLGDSAVVAAADPDHGPKGGPRVASAQVAHSGGSSFSLRPVRIETPGSGQAMALSQRYVVRSQSPASHPVAVPKPAPNKPVAVKPPPNKPAVKPPPAHPAPAGAPAPSPPPTPPAGPLLVANFENGLTGWSTSVLGDTVPRVVTGTVRDGSRSVAIRLTGDQSRSQLALGGDGGYDGAIRIHDGDEYAFAFSFYIEKMVYGTPGADNLLMQLRSDGSDSRVFGLQLWDYPVENGGRGLWSSGEAVNGDRFLGDATERTWHDVVIHFKASNQGAGSYEVYLDGQLVDARSEVSLIAPGSDFAQIEVGLFRDGDLVQGTSEIRIDAARFGGTLESVLG
jgi:hypothetical protein